MARPVSAAFKNAWKRKAGVRDLLRVHYKRRYWDGASFAYENDWQLMPASMFKGFGDIPMQLDSPLQNVFRTSVVTLRVDNTINQFVQDEAPPSFFAADNVATSGYRIYKSQFRLQFGYVLADGTEEYTSVFTGFALRVKLSSLDGLAEIILTSKALLMEKSVAADIATLFTLEDCIPATGNGVIKDFETTSLGVDHLTAVQVNAVSQSQGSAWKLSRANEIADADSNGRALITFTSPPGAGLTVKCSGVKWPQNQEINDIINNLADNAGISAADRIIAEILFPGGTSSSKSIDTQAHWEAGTVETNVEVTVGKLGKKWLLLDDFADLDYTTGPTWTISYQKAFSISTASGALVQNYVSDGINQYHGVAMSTSLTKAYGTWVFDYTATPITGQQIRGLVHIIALTNSGAPDQEPDGYAFVFNEDLFPAKFNFVRCDGGALTVLLDLGVTDSSAHTWRITRTTAGLFEVFKDGVSKGTVTDATYTTNAFFRVATDNQASLAITTTIDNIWVSNSVEPSETPSSTLAIFESAEQDLLVVPSALGSFDVVETLNGGSIVYKTAAASSAGGPYDSYVTVVGGVNGSLPKRYQKVRVELTPQAGNTESPLVDRVTINFSSSQVLMALAVQKGSGMDMLEKYLDLADYEGGFDGDGKLFVRAKSTSGAATVELDQDNGIIEISDWDNGFDQIINVGRVRSGNTGEYLTEYDGIDAGEASPKSETEYGRIAFERNLTDFLLANDANISTSKARTIYENNYRPKLRIRASIWIVPWLELSDIVSVSLYDNPLLRETIAGDPLQVVNTGFMDAGEAQNVLARAGSMKVLEYKPNYDTNIAEVYLEEILS